MQQQTLMKWDPATGEEKPFPSHAAQWRDYNGSAAWLFNPWADKPARRAASDVGSDPFGLLILPRGETVTITLTITESQSPARFEKRDGFVADRELGLEWGPTLDGKHAWEKAKAKAEAFGGGDAGWRLPTVQELRSLVDYNRSKPAIDTEFFGDTRFDDWYWSSSPVVGWPEFAWGVGFSYGGVYGHHRGYDGFVRPVRAARARQ